MATTAVGKFFFEEIKELPYKLNYDLLNCVKIFGANEYHSLDITISYIKIILFSEKYSIKKWIKMHMWWEKIQAHEGNVKYGQLKTFVITTDNQLGKTGGRKWFVEEDLIFKADYAWVKLNFVCVCERERFGLGLFKLFFFI